MGIISRVTGNLSRRKARALNNININDDTCSSCKKLIFTSDEFYNS